MKIKFEGIAENLNDIHKINETNLIDRIEFVKDLNEGGLTPEYSDILEALKITHIPLYVMIREHNNGFFYNIDEFNKMKDLVNKIKTTTVKGIVFGSLNQNGTINEDQLKEMIEIAKPLKITFHRAIDESSDYIKAIETLNEFDIENILTSGTKNKASDGMEWIEKAILISRHNIQPGSGIDLENIKLFKNLKINYLHFGSAIKENGIVSQTKIKKLREELEK